MSSDFSKIGMNPSKLHINEWFLKNNYVKRLCILIKSSRILLVLVIWSVFFTLIRWLILPRSLLSCVCTLEVLRILRVTSPLLIVLSNKEGNHCVDAILPFILGYVPTQFNGMRKCKYHLQSTRGFGYSYLFLPTGAVSIFVLSPL